MSAVEISAGLLSEVKNYLDVTWEDSGTNAKLTGQIRRGIDYITAKTGVKSSVFESSSSEYDGRAQELLFNYVLYDRAGAVDQFKQNYASDIVGLRLRWEVANATKSEG